MFSSPLFNKTTLLLRERLGVLDQGLSVAEVERTMIAHRRQADQARQEKRRRNLTPEQRERERLRGRARRAKAKQQAVISWNIARKSSPNRAQYNAFKREWRRKKRELRMRQQWKTTHPGMPFAPRHGMKWTTREDDRLRTYFNISTDKQLRRKFGRTMEGIIQHADELGLTRRSNIATSTDIARILGVAQSKVVAHVEAGDFTAHRHRRFLAVHVESVVTYLVSHPWAYDPDVMNADHYITGALLAALDGDRYLTTKEAGERVCVSSQTIYDWITSGVLEAHRRTAKAGNGIMWVVSRAALDDFMSHHDSDTRRNKGEASRRNHAMRKDEHSSLARSLPRPNDIAVGDLVDVPCGAIVNGRRTIGLRGTVVGLYVGYTKKPNIGWVWRATIETQRRHAKYSSPDGLIRIPAFLHDCLLVARAEAMGETFQEAAG